MKTLKILLLLATIGLGSAVMAQTKPDVLMMRVYEPAIGKGLILISQSGKIIKTIELNKHFPWAPNMELIDAAMNEYLIEGYKIITSNGGGHQSLIITTYILEREETLKEQ